ncbi:MAG: preprotein translocase subunit SecG [Acidobacteriota bacterium]
MLYFLYAIFFISCFMLVAAVLLQPGKTDAGALFTSNVSSSAYGPRGTASVLSKLTITAAIIFMLSALMISMPAMSGNVSVLQNVGDMPVETPASDAAVTGDNSNANTVTPPADNANAAPGVNAPAADSNTNSANTNAPANTTP